jgi:predicted ATP-grasp superfamily ATP-dependent carboligase
MRTALVADLAAIDGLEIATTTDPRFLRPAPAGVTVVSVGPGSARVPAELMRWADAVWAIAPESDGCLARLVRLVERRGKTLLGASARAVRGASDKAALARRLSRVGIAHPATIVLSDRTDLREAARRLGFPLVVKPRYGAGARGVSLVRSTRELCSAVSAARRVNASLTSRRTVLLQSFVPGVAASVCLVANGRHAVALAVNSQRVRLGSGAGYQGGRTPLDHPLASAAAQMAEHACAAFQDLRGYAGRGLHGSAGGGLRGYVGVDLMLTDEGPVVVEVNPRLTTAYLGVRASVDENVAALVLEACAGRLPAAPAARRCVRFTATGRVAAA